MRKTARITVPATTAKWYNARNQFTDRERAEFVAPRVKLAVEVWDVLADGEDWTVRDLCDATGGLPRSVRRLLHAFDVAGLVTLTGVGGRGRQRNLTARRRKERAA